jgi:hypothetical protein
MGDDTAVSGKHVIMLFSYFHTSVDNVIITNIIIKQDLNIVT